MFLPQSGYVRGVKLVLLPEVLEERLIDPPSLSEAQQALVDADHEMLMRTGGYDSHAVFCHRINGESAEVFYAPYSWKRAVEQHPELGIGASSIRLLLHRSDGCWLWARRTPTLGGYWSWAAAGGVDPGETHAQAAIRETVEELGVSPDSIDRLRLVGRIDGSGYSTVWTAELKDGATVVPDPHEVSDVAWLASPYTLDPLGQALQTLRAQIEPILAAS